MEKRVIKSTKWACSLALVLWSLFALVYVLRLLRYCGLISFNIYCGIDIAPIVWCDDDPEFVTVQWVELIGYAVTTFCLLCLSLRLILMTRRGLVYGKVFTARNAHILMMLVPVVFFQVLFDDNLSIIFGSRQLYIGSTPFTSSLVTLIVAMLYRLAVIESEENSLTI